MTPNKTLKEDPFLPLRSNIDGTSPERQQDIRRFIGAFTRTVGFAHTWTHPTLPPLLLVSRLTLSALRNIHSLAPTRPDQKKQGNPHQSGLLLRLTMNPNFT